MLLAVRSFSSGILFSAAALTRSSLLPLAPIDAAVLFLTRQWALGTRLLIGFAFGIGIHWFLSQMGLIKNSSILAEDLMIAIGGNSTTGIDFHPRWITANELAHPIATYIQFALAHPIQFFWQRVSSLWELWGPWPAATVSDLGESRSSLARILIALHFPALLLAAAAMWKRRNSLKVWLLASPILMITAVHMMFYSVPRYTFPAEPGLIVLATIGLGDLLAYRKSEEVRVG